MGSKNKTSSTGGTGTSSSGGGRGSDRSGRIETNRRKSEIDPKRLDEGKKKVKEIIKNKDMYGGSASKAVNEYLLSIGEAKRTGGGGYLLTSTGWKMKYGSYTAGQAQEGTAMGTGDAGGIITSIPITKKMFDRQKKIKSIALLGASLLNPTNIASTAMRMEAARSYGQTYEDYMKGFKAKQKESFSLAVNSANQMTANKATGEVFEVTGTPSDKKKSKTSKNTTKYFAGTGSDESTNKRTFF